MAALLRYSYLVKPESPAVRALVAPALEALAQGEPASREALVACVLEALHGFRYIDQAGMRARSVDDTVAKRSGNCLALAVLLCTMLRQAGLSDREVFVCIGSPRGFHTTTVHAYVAITGMDEPGLLLVDPETMRPARIAADDLLARYSIFVVFNDALQTIDSQQKRALLASEAAPAATSSTSRA